MSSKQEDENYWNRSDFKPFSFDDEEFQLNNKIGHFGSSISNSFVTDIIFDGVPLVKKPEPEKRPLETLISTHSLNKIFGENNSFSNSKLSAEEELILLRRQLNNKWVPLSVTKTIKLIMTGQPYSFHLYRTLELKKELLDAAIKIGDGDAILAVVIFLSKTLKKSLFYQIVQSRPTAVSHYAQYLSTKLMIFELIDLLEMLGQTRDAAMKQFTFLVQGTQNKETRLQRLKNCLNNHFSSHNSRDKNLVQDYVQFLQWITSLDSSTDKDALENSVLFSLSYLCKNYWNEQKTNKYSPWFLIGQQAITDRQIDWTILTSRASLQCWEDIETHFLTKGWIGGKKLKSSVPVEKILLELNRHDAPYNILLQYLEIIGSLDKRLELAKQLTCHKAVIDVLVLMKDRQGIVEYKINLKPQSEEYLFAEIALKSQIKWKN